MTDEFEVVGAVVLVVLLFISLKSTSTSVLLEELTVLLLLLSTALELLLREIELEYDNGLWEAEDEDDAVVVNGIPDVLVLDEEGGVVKEDIDVLVDAIAGVLEDAETETDTACFLRMERRGNEAIGDEEVGFDVNGAGFGFNVSIDGFVGGFSGGGIRIGIIVPLTPGLELIELDSNLSLDWWILRCHCDY
ncbi:hypothetical protein BDP27DRAFT_1363766 [Rhodocollybia butyracea]|uniref:Uncharacterized protein n=1 Tax=Rhodocollybia butyracea TaxID=206335 RepID=A0A9P5PMX0_9AGAR|nr:hypothetical protein BDP27DRAFT_1363766 [Rhodocollybia butyracea]